MTLVSLAKSLVIWKISTVSKYLTKSRVCLQNTFHKSRRTIFKNGYNYLFHEILEYGLWQKCRDKSKILGLLLRCTWSTLRYKRLQIDGHTQDTHARDRKKAAYCCSVWGREKAEATHVSTAGLCRPGVSAHWNGTRSWVPLQMDCLKKQKWSESNSDSLV